MTRSVSSFGARLSKASRAVERQMWLSGLSFVYSEVKQAIAQDSPREIEEEIARDSAREADQEILPVVRPVADVMQVHSSYIVTQDQHGLVIIDQHALHERVMYEHLRRRVLSGAVESQRLLAPEPVELGPREAALVLEHRELLGQLGFGIEEFGGSTVLLSAYPAMLARADRTALVRDLAERLDEAGAAPSRRELLDSLLHMMSCKAAIKAGHRLSPDEMESLIAQRHLIDDAHHCPHGRPTALVLTRAQLDRQFGRLG